MPNKETVNVGLLFECISGCLSINPTVPKTVREEQHVFHRIWTRPCRFLEHDLRCILQRFSGAGGATQWTSHLHRRFDLLFGGESVEVEVVDDPVIEGRHRDAQGRVSPGCHLLAQPIHHQSQRLHHFRKLRLVEAPRHVNEEQNVALFRCFSCRGGLRWG